MEIKSMIVASVNCNKRLSNPRTKGIFEKWLMESKIDLVFAQEPWPHGSSSVVDFLYYKPLGGNSRVFAWVKEGYSLNQSEIIYPYLQKVDADYLILHNLYLDAYSRTTRGEQLAAINKHLMGYGDRPQVIFGDFNIAPNPEDGISKDSYSNFNGREDRGPLNDLLLNFGMVDTTSKETLGHHEFTIIKNIGQTQTKFRCDLCLVSDYLLAGDVFKARYDHSVRERTGFTDHSALIFTLPLDVHRRKETFQRTLFPLDEPEETLDEVNYSPHKTAIARTTPSPAARLIRSEKLSKELGEIRRILDYGCGRGRDVDYYRTNGYDADGYDPYAPFGFSTLPTGLFDLITVIFVVNVLPNCWERLQVVKKAADYLRPGGYMLLVARSRETIESEARTKGWKTHNDGYWSHEGKGTFQKGINSIEMISLIKRAGLNPHPITSHLYIDQATSIVLAVKKEM
jgi:SAM-dependent methyltransferase